MQVGAAGHTPFAFAAEHVTVADPDNEKPDSHANVATLAWASPSENSTLPSVGGAGGLEHVVAEQDNMPPCARF